MITFTMFTFTVIKINLACQMYIDTHTHGCTHALTHTHGSIKVSYYIYLEIKMRVLAWTSINTFKMWIFLWPDH